MAIGNKQFTAQWAYTDGSTAPQWEGPLGQWLEGGKYEIPFQYGLEIQKAIYPRATLRTSNVLSINSNVYMDKRIQRRQNSDVSNTYTINGGQNIVYAATSGSFDNYQLNEKAVVSLIFDEQEIRSAGGGFIDAYISDELEVLARYYEDKLFEALVKKGRDDTTDIESNPDDKPVDVYKSFLKWNTLLSREGQSYNRYPTYVEPQLIEALMQDSHFISNGQSSIQSQEVRYGFRGVFVGRQIIEVPLMNLFTAQPQGEDVVKINAVWFNEAKVQHLRWLYFPSQILKYPTALSPNKLCFLGIEYFTFAVKEVGQEEITGRQTGFAAHYAKFALA